MDKRRIKITIRFTKQEQRAISRISAADQVSPSFASATLKIGTSAHTFNALETNVLRRWLTNQPDQLTHHAALALEKICEADNEAQRLIEQERLYHERQARRHTGRGY